MKETLKERRVRVFGELPVFQMSTTTRYYFKRWGIRIDEIIDWERWNAGRTKHKKKERPAAKVIIHYDKKLEEKLSSDDMSLEGVSLNVKDSRIAV